MLFELFKQCWNTTWVKGQMISVNRFQRECTLQRIGRMEVIATHTHTHIYAYLGEQGGNRMDPLGKKESKREDKAESEREGSAQEGRVTGIK